MSGLWNIYRSDGQQLGPYSASEIREALRDGSIDPFDQVARVGSKLKQSLVEVDEIFQDTAAEAPKVDSVYDQTEGLANRGHNLAATAHSVPLGKKGKLATAISRARQSNAAGGAPRQARLRPAAQRRADQAKKYAKRFYLLDKRNRLLGPLSAAEIQSLFYRGIIDQDVLVSKDKGDKRVPVQQFIAAYVGAKAKKFKSEQTRLHLDPGGHYAYPSSRVMDQLSRSAAAIRLKSTSNVPWLSLAILCLAVILVALIAKKVFFSEQASPDDRTPDREYPQSIQIQAPDQPRPAARQAQAPRQPQATPVVQQADPVNRQTVKPAATPRPKPQVRQRPKPKPQRKSTRGRLSRPARPRSTPRPIVRRTTPSQPAPVRRAPVRRAAPRDPYAGRVGSVVTIGGARYSVGAVSRCGGMKCTITFRDRSGTSFSVVFFRARYQDQLQRAGGRATIVGRLDKKGASYVIYLSGVR